ncbi:MAG: alanine--glyoxylate aminotransferase family protein [Planctomycetota bacterium]|nr:alanine--glyoxylate aminotransferase family protein [Planctomycetota bacterium]HBO51825.1 alanine--glyoxylate aminotransferase [Planctomycetota bacterium]
MSEKTIYPRGRLLMGPGPSGVHPRVHEALSSPVVGHLDPQFLGIMDNIQKMLRRLFRTENRLTIAVSGTGSAGMESAFVNVVEPGDEVLVCVNGVFGNRMSDIVERIGGVLHRIDRPWGEVFELSEIEDALASHPEVKAVAIVHAETSTGALQPLEEIGKLCRSSGRLFLVDCVTSLGGERFEADEWNVDVAYSGTQKCLSCPPGLAPVTFSERAVEKLKGRESKVVSWYLDLSMIEKYWTDGERAYHHTAPISMNYALHEALCLVLEEGLEARWERHRRNSAALVAGLEALGFRLFAQEGHRLPMLNAVWIPEGVDDAGFRKALLDDYDIEVGGGLGEVAGKIWRIGLMGETSSRESIMTFLGALEALLQASGCLESPGSGLEAAAADLG